MIMQKELRKLQLTQLEILKEIDRICQEYGISYSLYAGTLLGAVRHQGFIPWDDDLDICMSRSEYNRFLQIWEKVKPEGYMLQNKENSPDFTQSFSKIRKLNTTYQMKVDFGKKYYQGIFVDIFPIDRFPEGKLQQLRFRIDCMLYQLYTREFAPPKSTGPIKWVCQAVLALTPKKVRMGIREKILSRITRYSEDGSCPAIAIETMGTLRTLYPADMLDHYIKLPFEDGEFQCFAAWDEHLRRKFGNYMRLPPEEERTWRHPPVQMDFEKYTLITE